MTGSSFVRESSVDSAPKDDHGFPWGENRPTRVQRLIVAATCATVAAAFTAFEYVNRSGHHSDFGQIWFGAGSLLGGVNPWPLVGPGLPYNHEWKLFYPATSLVAAMPLTLLSEAVASTLFIWLSVAALVWGITHNSWHRLPALVSLPFVVSASAGQWSPLLASSWFIPASAAVWACKPSLGLALAVSTPSRKSLAVGALGAIILLGLSFWFLPAWPGYWLEALRGISHMRSPVLNWGGFAVVACVLRWRRPEAWLVLALACVPQSPAVYDLLLILVIVPRTYREACVLSLICTTGLLLLNALPVTTQEAFISLRGTMNVLCCYLPATILILRRDNSGEGPAWLSLLSQKFVRK